MHEFIILSHKYAFLFVTAHFEKQVLKRSRLFFQVLIQVVMLTTILKSLSNLSYSPQGREILTGRIETGNYFHLHLNQYDLVETITCLSLKPFPVSNYLCLYGKHELLLNHLCSRYDEGQVHDLYR